MFGFRFIKTQPNQHVIAFRDGRPVREGAGLAFWYFAATTSIVVVPTESRSEPFIFQNVTGDFQDVTVQGQISYRIADPRRTASLLNFSVNNRSAYESEDPAKLSQILIDQVQVKVRGALQGLSLKEALASGEALVGEVGAAVRASDTLETLGVALLGLSILAVKPKPETARALEAETREALLRRADEATYARRNAAVEQERTIKENELATEVAIENKKRQVREAAMEAERAVQEKRLLIEQEKMAGKITLEEQNGHLVSLTAANARAEADAKAYGLATMLQAFAGADGRLMQTLASVGMDPAQMMALAFRDLADNANKIGQLNLSPDLLREMMTAREA